MSATPQHRPLVLTTRGGMVECVHYGSIAVVDIEGKQIAGAGDPTSLNYPRSALKPLQALPFVEADGVARFGFTSHELAMMCASHNGEAIHVNTVQRMLDRIDACEQDLQCGCHIPDFYRASGEPVPAQHFNQLFHNCSGKHTGFLAYCRMFGHRKQDYLAPDSPLQTRIQNVIRVFAGGDSLGQGIDGCNAPTFALPLNRLAQTYARLAAGDTAELSALRYAMTRHPDLVSGSRRLDAALMLAGDGDWVCKSGADGTQVIGVRSRGIGIAVRVADGSPRALHLAAVSALEQLGLLSEQSAALLSPFAERVQRNYRNVEVGRVEPAFALPMLMH